MRKKSAKVIFLTNQNYHKTEKMQNFLENSEMKKNFLYLKNCPKNHQKNQKWLFLAKNAFFFSFFFFSIGVRAKFFQFWTKKSILQFLYFMKASIRSKMVFADFFFSFLVWWIFNQISNILIICCYSWYCVTKSWL